MFQLEKGKNAMRKLLLATTKNLFATACVLISLVSAAQAQGFRVTQTFLKADDGRMSGPCPMKVVFEGYITVDGPGTVAYTFTRSDGATAPIYKIEFKQAGSQSITTDWTLGDQRDLPSYSGWQAIKIISPNELESSHETGAFSIACSPAKAGIGEQTTVSNVSGNVKGSGTGNPGSGNARRGVAGVIPSVPPAARCYLVTLNGFTVNHATSDDVLQRDGAGDEVYLNTPVVFRVSSSGVRIVSAGAFGPGYGERRANESGRIQAGHATPNGGLRTGDSFPSDTPWRRDSISVGLGIPYRFYEGPIVPGELLVVVPSLWEWDGAYNNMSQNYGDMVNDLRVHISAWINNEGYDGFIHRMLSGGNMPVVKTFSELGLRLSASIGLDPFNPGPRPIGMRLPRGQGDLAFFDPQILFLTAEAADYMTRNDAHRLGAGVMPFRYRDDVDLEGDYTLYLQTEHADCRRP
jgi:hypothetical protein